MTQIEYLLYLWQRLWKFHIYTAEKRVDPGSFPEDFVEVPYQLPEGVDAIDALPEIPGNNQDEEYGNLNNGSNGSWEKVNSPTDLERGIAKFGATPIKMLKIHF